MPTAAELMQQVLEPIAVGETADQEFVGEFDFDPSGTAFLFTLTSRPGRSPALELTTAGGGIEVAVTGPASGVYTATITVHYERDGDDLENTSDLDPGDYAFDLWDTTNDARVAAGVQPVVTPSRLDS